MTKRYEGTFVAYSTVYGTIILKDTSCNNNNIGLVYLKVQYTPDLVRKLRYGDKIEFYCDHIEYNFVKSPVDINIIKTCQLK